jgi:hypothetical protein
MTPNLTGRDYGTNQKGEVDCHMSEGEVEHEQFFSSMDDLEAYVVETYSF